ncbi:iron-containing redox enzyme family protein [Microbulbifer sp. SSSA007]|uniref:iron-containing redox enzyme family protein n=1 Tax=Microbulbifer TaxID=48073 RepID=UPI00037AE5D4|nr:iron-containing redox enzyme family protein [Microbulbifer variabilis]
MSFQKTAWLKQLSEEALSHRAVHHPYLLRFANGDLPNFKHAVGDFAQQYGFYSSRFINMLAAVISRLTLKRHRSVLLENLKEESGHYEESELRELEQYGIKKNWVDNISHTELFERFKSHVTQDIPESCQSEGIVWYEMLSDVLLHGSTEEAIGAIGMGTEHIVSSIYPYIEKGLKNLQSLKLEEYCFFPVHTLVDDSHTENLNQVALDFADTEEGRRHLRHGAIKALNLRAAFWDGLLDRAMKSSEYISMDNVQKGMNNESYYIN